MVSDFFVFCNAVLTNVVIYFKISRDNFVAMKKSIDCSSESVRVLCTGGEYPSIDLMKRVVHDSKNKLSAIAYDLRYCQDFVTLLNLYSDNIERALNCYGQVSSTIKRVYAELLNGNDGIDVLREISAVRKGLRPILMELEPLTTMECEESRVIYQEINIAVEEIEKLFEKLFLSPEMAEKEYKSQMDLSEFIEEIISRYQVYYPTVQFNISTGYKNGSFVDFYPDSLKTALENIIINAVQSFPNMVGEITIGLSLKSISGEDKPFVTIEDGSYYVIEVMDNGCGIAPELLLKIPHSQITTKKNGSGVGLHSVSSALRKCKGHLMLESQEGSYTKVTALLPSSHPPPITEEFKSKGA
ncbi:hypothetical protein GF340_05995 [Candidatus Peregrinibacteria bacterium]|nr:hypothetical protein [Candidatus Peregrinibacteria bacterium]